jgi:hypothetical protein
LEARHAFIIHLGLSIEIYRAAIQKDGSGCRSEGGQATGSLVVQTIGVTGKQVSTSLPMPSELNQTTVQTAILSLGSIKAIIYDKESALVTPRMTGIYLPIPAGSEQLLNKIVSELARYPIRWHRGCKFVEKKA